MADVTVTATDAADDDLRELHDLLTREPELRGRVILSGGSPRPGTMGVLTEVLTMALAPGGAGTAFAAVAVTYLRQRGSRVRLRVTRPDGQSMDLVASNIRELDAQAVRVQAADLARFLGNDGDDGRAVAGPGSGEPEE